MELRVLQEWKQDMYTEKNIWILPTQAPGSV